MLTHAEVEEIITDSTYLAWDRPNRQKLAYKLLCNLDKYGVENTIHLLASWVYDTWSINLFNELRRVEVNMD